MCSIIITTRASHIAELTTKKIATSSEGPTGSCFHTNLLLLVLLPLMMLLVWLRTHTRYLANLTVIQQRWFGRCSKAFEDMSTLLHVGRTHHQAEAHPKQEHHLE